jgi:hypothetical protein
MAIYPIWNPETGEKKIIDMSVNEIQNWYKENSPWTRDWSQGCATGITEVGDWQNKLIKKHPDWNEVIKKVHKSGGSNSKIGKI